MTSAANLPFHATAERVKEIRERDQCSLQEAKKKANMEILDQMIEQTFTMHDLRATLRKVKEFL